MERLALSSRRLTAAQFSVALAEFTESLRREIETSVPEFPVDPAAAEARRGRAAHDLRFFAATYFPHYRDVEAEAELHTWIYDEVPARIDAADGARIAFAAPRGQGKSTVISLQLLIWCLLTARKHFLILVADTGDQAKILLGAVKAELDTNPRLISDWPDDAGAGPVWREGQIVTASNRMVLTRGSGQAIRGLRHGPWRPDLIIGDDLEDDESVVALARRKKLAAWLHAAVLYAGPPDGSLDVIVVGTILHYDSLLANLIASKLWLGPVFAAVPVWPDATDRWDKFAELATTEGKEAALAYYDAHRAEMDAGAVLSWPAMQSLAMLMLEWAEDPTAFAKERQNKPAAAEDAIFAGTLQYWAEKDLPDALALFGAVDPSLGRQGAGRDPSAILVGGVPLGASVRRRLYVLHAAIRRRTPDQIIDDVIALQRKWLCLLWAVESVAFQEFLRTSLVDRSAAAGVPVPARPVIPHTDKQLRIQSLQPHVKNGLILLHRSQLTLIDQIEHYPHADHDDGPDALHMLFQAAMAGSGAAGRIRSTPRPDVAPIPWEGY